MNDFSDKFNNYINAHPRQSLKILVSVIFILWMSPVFVLGIVLYFILSKMARIPWWMILSIGLFIVADVVFIHASLSSTHFDIQSYLVKAFTCNKLFWKLFFTHSSYLAFAFLYQYAFSYVVGFPLFFAGILSATDLIKDSPHQSTMEALQKGIHIVDKELAENKIKNALNKIDDSRADGVLLGVSTYTGKPVIIPDYFVNQVVLVLGTTGAGKTITLRRFYHRATTKGYPLIVVDGKPTNENVAWLQSLAKKYNRTFYGFNCGNYSHYDPLSNGDHSELKDKIITLKDQWESDYYRSIAEDYLQTTLEVLLISGQPFDLKKVVECLDYDKLCELVRATKNGTLSKRVVSLESYERKDIMGLQAHLNILIHSSMGAYFVKNENTFNLLESIKNDAIIYFALPALRYPSFSKVLGKLVINDLKAVIDRNDENKRVFMVFDEFSVFAGDQVLNLVNMGRGKGVHAIFGTQGIADLNIVDENFTNQILNCTNTLISHRLNDQESVETVSTWIGTKDIFTSTAQYNSNNTGAEMGSVKFDKGFIAHPEAIKQGMWTGDVYFASKVDGFRWDKVRVVYQ